MKARFAAAAALLLSLSGLLLSLAGIASAHRLDEYLQATLISVEKDRIEVSLRLVPGVAVASAVLAKIDANGDGVISPGEQQAYAQRVLGDLALSIDGRRLTPKLASVNFPAVEQMREGLGEIRIEFTSDLPQGGP